MSEFDDGRNIYRRKFSKEELKDSHDTRGNNSRRTPIILTKAERDTEREGRERDRERAVDSRSPTNKPTTIILRTREGESRAVSPSLQQRTPIVLKKENAESSQPSYQLAYKQSSSQGSSTSTQAPEMKTCVKLIDESLQFCDVPTDLFLEQNDFLVVGCIGLQGVGKSTVLSLLAGGSTENIEKDMCFKPQGMEQHETGTHCTIGVDMWVTHNRVLLLDTQPLLSASILDRMGNLDISSATGGSGSKKFPGAVGPVGGVGVGVGAGVSGPSGSAAMDLGLLTNTEAAMEIQSLQLAAFILSVCHVVILTQDWFFDPNILRFLQTAEMLKPPTPTTGPDETLVEYFPHLFFVQNRAQPSEFAPDYVKMIQNVYSLSFRKSKLLISSGMGIATGNVINVLNPQTCADPINLFLLPEIQPPSSENAHGFCGHPGVSELILKLRQQILGAPRQPLTHHPLTEKNWLLYASKVWDGIRKSTFFHEYSRLLP